MLVIAPKTVRDEEATARAAAQQLARVLAALELLEGTLHDSLDLDPALFATLDRNFGGRWRDSLHFMLQAIEHAGLDANAPAPVVLAARRMSAAVMDVA